VRPCRPERSEGVTPGQTIDPSTDHSTCNASLRGFNSNHRIQRGSARIVEYGRRSSTPSAIHGKPSNRPPLVLSEAEQDALRPERSEGEGLRLRCRPERSEGKGKVSACGVALSEAKTKVSACGVALSEAKGKVSADFHSGCTDCVTAPIAGRARLTVNDSWRIAHRAPEIENDSASTDDYPLQSAHLRETIDDTPMRNVNSRSNRVPHLAATAHRLHPERTRHHP
jgi:hypothetical protein